MFREEESLFSKAKFVSKGWPTVWISFVLPFCGFLTDHIHFSYCILSSNVTVLSQSETSGYLHLPPAPIQWQPVLIKHNAVESYHDQFNTSCLYGEVRAVCQMGTVSEGMVSRGTIVADGPTKNSRVKLTAWVDGGPSQAWADEKPKQKHTYTTCVLIWCVRREQNIYNKRGLNFHTMAFIYLCSFYLKNFWFSLVN